MKKNKFGLVLVTAFLSGLIIACSHDSGNEKSGSDSSTKLPRHLQSYEIKGVRFAYYLVPKDLNKIELIKTGKEIHEMEPDSHLLLVDDDSEIDAYINYAKTVSSGGEPRDLPVEWADKHIVANVQKYLNGRWVLCTGNGYEEIADIE